MKVPAYEAAEWCGLMVVALSNSFLLKCEIKDLTINLTPWEVSLGRRSQALAS